MLGFEKELLIFGIDLDSLSLGVNPDFVSTESQASHDLIPASLDLGLVLTVTMTVLTKALHLHLPAFGKDQVSSF